MKLSPQQQSLAYAGYYGDREAITSYILDKDTGIKTLQKKLSEDNFDEFIYYYRKHPTEFSAYCRLNILNLFNDENLDEKSKLKRMGRYLDNYFDLICQLDKEAFPHDEKKVYNFVPEYLPDGYSDMGSNPEVDEEKRNKREKIYLNKAAVLKQSRQFLGNLFYNNIYKKEDIVEEISAWIYRNMPYDYKDYGDKFGGKSIRIDKLFDPNDSKSVCRHHALYTQVLNQTMGITSRMLKCNFYLNGKNLGPHASNLVRLNYQWYLLDTTNPFVKKDGTGEVYLRKIPETNIDLNNNIYSWEFQDGDDHRKYVSRNNMYFRIK